MVRGPEAHHLQGAALVSGAVAPTLSTWSPEHLASFLALQEALADAFQGREMKAPSSAQVCFPTPVPRTLSFASSAYFSWVLPTVTPASPFQILCRPGSTRDPLSPPTSRFKGDQGMLSREAPGKPTHFEVLGKQALTGQELVVRLPGCLAGSRRSPTLLLGSKPELLPPALQLPGGGDTQENGSSS